MSLLHWRRFLPGPYRQRDCEDRPSARCIGGFDVSCVLAQHGLADAQSEAGAAAGAFGGEERIKNVRQVFGSDAGAVILKYDPYGIRISSHPHANCTLLAILANCLLRIQKEIQKHLHQLIGIGD